MKKVLLIDSEANECDTLLLTDEQVRLLMFLSTGGYLRYELEVFDLSVDTQFIPI